MLEDSLDHISNPVFPFKPCMRLSSFIEDRVIFISDQNAFISYKNHLLFITRLLYPSEIEFSYYLSPNTISLSRLKTVCILKTSHLAKCGHIKCNCINQYGNLLNFTSNSNVLALYFTGNLIVTYKLSWLLTDSVFNEDIGLNLIKNLEFKAKRGILTCIALDDLGDYLACSYCDSTTLIYHSENVYRTFNVKNTVSFMRFHKSCLFCSSQQGDIYIYYISENVIKLCRGHNSNISDFCFLSFNSTNGFISSSFDSIVNLYSLEYNVTSKSSNSDLQIPLKQFLFSSPVIGVNIISTNFFDQQFDTESPWLLFVITENSIFELIDPATITSLKKVSSGCSSIKRTFFSNNFFVVFTSYLELEFYDLKTFAPLFSSCCNFDKCYYSRMIQIPITNFNVQHPYPRFSLVLNGDEKVRLVSMNGFNMQIILYNHPDVVLSADMLEEFLASGSKDGTLILYNLALNNIIKTISASKHSILSTAILRHSNNLNVITADFENIVKIWSFEGSLIHLVVAHNKTINHIAISPNRKMIATSGSDKIVKIFNNRLEVLGVCSGHLKSINYSMFIEKDMLLMSASNDSLIKCWNVKSYECIKTFQGHDNPVLVLAQLNDFHIASADALGIIKIWNMRNAACSYTLQPHSKRIWHMSLDSNNLITCSEDGTVILWEHIENANLLASSKERIQDEMEIDFLVLSKCYIDALYLSLKLDMPSKSLEIVYIFSETIIFSDFNQGDPIDYNCEFNLIRPLVDKIINAHEKCDEFSNMVYNLCKFIRVCISNAKTSIIGNAFLNVLLKQYSLKNLNAACNHLQLDDVLLLQSKHYNRIFHMSEKARLLDLLLLDCGDLQMSRTLKYLNY